jgi:hypothetical protein
MPVDFYLGLSPPKSRISPSVLISHSILKAAARSGETNVYCGACRKPLATGISVVGLSAAFCCEGHPLEVDCPHCGMHNRMPTDAEPASAFPRRAA